MPTKRTIIAAGEGKRYEAEAASAVSPGELVQLNSTGLALRHATALARAAPMFAIENEIFGKGVEVDYAAGDRVLIEHCDSGMEVNVMIPANAAAIVIGDYLESAGDGTLRKKTTGVELAQAVESFNNSAIASKTRIRARIL